MCCVFSGYHGVAAHVKQNHDIYATANQNEKLLIQSQQKTWSVSAEAYEANARDFGISCPKFSVHAIMQWHLNYEGPKLSLSDEQDVTIFPLVRVPLSAPSGLNFAQDHLVPIHESPAHVQTPEPSPNLVGSVATPSGDGP